MTSPPTSPAMPACPARRRPRSPAARRPRPRQRLLGRHTLAAAKTGGTVGPNLDEVLAGQSFSMIEESILDPNAEVIPGYPTNVMPTNFGQPLIA